MYTLYSILICLLTPIPVEIAAIQARANRGLEPNTRRKKLLRETGEKFLLWFGLGSGKLCPVLGHVFWWIKKKKEKGSIYME